MGFPHCSVGKESACNGGDPGSIPGSGRSTGEGIGYPLQYSWASLVVQLVKNQSAMQETWVWSLGWEDPLQKGKATLSSILARRIPWTVLPMRLQRVRHDWVTFSFTFCTFPINLLWALKCFLKNSKEKEREERREVETRLRSSIYSVTGQDFNSGLVPTSLFSSPWQSTLTA